LGILHPGEGVALRCEASQIVLPLLDRAADLRARLGVGRGRRVLRRRSGGEGAKKGEGEKEAVPHPSEGLWRLTRSRSSLPVRMRMPRWGLPSIRSPVFGLRPTEASYCVPGKAPKPRISMFSPRQSEGFIESKRL